MKSATFLLCNYDGLSCDVSQWGWRNAKNIFPSSFTREIDSVPRRGEKWPSSCGQDRRLGISGCDRLFNRVELLRAYYLAKISRQTGKFGVVWFAVFFLCFGFYGHRNSGKLGKMRKTPFWWFDGRNKERHNALAFLFLFRNLGTHLNW